MTDVRVETQIGRPRADVAAYMFDPANDAEWTTGVIAVNPLQPGRLGPGSRVERTVRFMGRQFGYRYRVTGAEGDRYVDMEADKPFPMQIRYELDDAPDGTVARIHARGNPTGFLRGAGALMEAMVRKNIEADLAALKRILESVP